MFFISCHLSNALKPVSYSSIYVGYLHLLLFWSESSAEEWTVDDIDYEPEAAPELVLNPEEEQSTSGGKSVEKGK